jgi:hypothetical protein
VHRLLFTPDDPAVFVAALNDALERWKAEHEAD